MATVKKAVEGFVSSGLETLDAVLMPLVPAILTASDNLSKASARFGKVTKPAYVAFLSAGKTQKEFRAWAMSLTHQSDSTIWNSLQAVLVLDSGTLPEGSESLPVGALVSLAGLTDGIGSAGVEMTAGERRLAVLEAAGDDRSERNIKALVKAEKERPKTEAEKAEAEKKKANDGAKAVRDDLTKVLDAIEANPDAYSPVELILIGVKLHSDHGINTAAGVKVIEAERSKARQDAEAKAKADAEAEAKRAAARDAMGGSAEAEAEAVKKANEKK